MIVPKKIEVDLKDKPRNALPADYYTDSEFDDDDLDDTPPPVKVESATRLMSPPEKLTIPEISDEERRRFLRESSLNGANVPFLDDSMYKTPNDTALKNMTSFQSGDPVSLARQVRHLHNRVKLLEEELQTQHNRQMLIFGVISVYILSRGVKLLMH